jgi:hypothetical protein
VFGCTDRPAWLGNCRTQDYWLPPEPDWIGHRGSIPYRRRAGTVLDAPRGLLSDSEARSRVGGRAATTSTPSLGSVFVPASVIALGCEAVSRVSVRVGIGLRAGGTGSIVSDSYNEPPDSPAGRIGREG